MSTIDNAVATIESRRNRSDSGTRTSSVDGLVPLPPTRRPATPAATVIGLDACPVDGAANAVPPSARARVSLRIAPGSDPQRQAEILTSFLQENAPRGAHVEVTNVKINQPFLAATDGPAVGLALDCLGEVFGKPAAQHGSGGSIPLVETFLSTSDGAEAILWGAEDEEKARIHGPDESVDPKELEDLIATQILFLARLAESR